jgi:galactokinase
MESKPMTTSEPTTGEIVRALRSMQTSAQVVLDSGFGTREGECDVVYRNRRDLAKNAADRLESQERNIETLRAFHERYAEQTSKKYVEEICALTARAEQAERERDAAVADMKYGRVCMTCKHDEKCRKEVAVTNQTRCIGKQRWEWRGLPQDGGMK